MNIIADWHFPVAQQREVTVSVAYGINSESNPWHNRNGRRYWARGKVDVESK